MDIKVFQLHKRASIKFNNIQDKFNLSLENKCIALSDGTTQSFKSELWAKMLVDWFASKPTFDLDVLKNNFKNLANEFTDLDFAYSSNFAKASLEKAKKNKGGTATFIALHFINDFNIKVLNCGDSCLFKLRENKIISFPFKNLEELDNNHNFINTSKLLEEEIENEYFNVEEIKLNKNDILILATDAISRLIFTKPEIITLILKCKNFDDFKILCETNWDNKELEEDDISIIVINPNLQNNITEIVPPNDFTFPEPEVVIFTPSTDKNIFSNNIKDLEMEQLQKIVQQLFRETNFLKDKIKLTQALLISTLAILILNTFLLFYFNHKINNEKEIVIKNENPIKYEEKQGIEVIENSNQNVEEEIKEKEIKEKEIEKKITPNEVIEKKEKKTIVKTNAVLEKKNTILKKEEVTKIPIIEEIKKPIIPETEIKKENPKE